MKKKIFIILLLVVIAAGVLFFLSSCLSSGGNGEQSVAETKRPERTSPKSFDISFFQNGVEVEKESLSFDLYQVSLDKGPFTLKVEYSNFGLRPMIAYFYSTSRYQFEISPDEPFFEKYIFTKYFGAPWVNKQDYPLVLNRIDNIYEEKGVLSYSILYYDAEDEHSTFSTVKFFPDRVVGYQDINRISYFNKGVSENIEESSIDEIFMTFYDWEKKIDIFLKFN